jgi:hypothetical protein
MSERREKKRRRFLPWFGDLLEPIAKHGKFKLFSSKYGDLGSSSQKGNLCKNSTALFFFFGVKNSPQKETLVSTRQTLDDQRCFFSIL